MNQTQRTYFIQKSGALANYLIGSDVPMLNILLEAGVDCDDLMEKISKEVTFMQHVIEQRSVDDRIGEVIQARLEYHVMLVNKFMETYKKVVSGEWIE